ncbi:MAG: crossover junction endodeoxyribonuclease RuvC [Phycisphaerales bacterium]
MRFLGIDPGLRLTGYGCVEFTPAARSTPRLVEAGVIRLPASESLSSRLAELDRDFRALLDALRPDAVAVEMLYAHYKHPATAIIMGHARGVLLLAITSRALPLIELRPTEIKKSLIGHGHASKEQMQEGVRAELRLDARPDPPDVADALAIALCGARRHELSVRCAPAGLPVPRR